MWLSSTQLLCLSINQYCSKHHFPSKQARQRRLLAPQARVNRPSFSWLRDSTIHSPVAKLILIKPISRTSIWKIWGSRSATWARNQSWSWVLSETTSYSAIRTRLRKIAERLSSRQAQTLSSSKRKVWTHLLARLASWTCQVDRSRGSRLPAHWSKDPRSWFWTKRHLHWTRKVK